MPPNANAPTEGALRKAHLLAIYVDLIERTPESKLLRDFAFRAWREVFIDMAPEAINDCL